MLQIIDFASTKRRFALYNTHCVLSICGFLTDEAKLKKMMFSQKQE